MKNLFLALTTALFLFSCNDDDDANMGKQDFLIFGHYYGMCSGEGCVETFKLTDKELFEDTIDDYMGQKQDFVPMGNEKFMQVRDLLDFFPNQLLYENKTVFGCPDCADGGGLFIQYSKNGVVKSWRMDQTRKNVPDYLHRFMDKVNEKIHLINN